MFSLDMQMGLAKAWTDTVVGCMTASTSTALDMTNQALSLWSQSAENVVPPAPPAATRAAVTPQRGRSWYRAPSQSPFEFGSAWPAGILPFPFASAFPFASGWPMMPPMGLFTWPGAPGLPSLLQSWTTMMAAGMSAFPLGQSFDWRAFGLPGLSRFWGGLPFLDALPSREQSAPFSVYRSNGGHAVAQITFPNQVIAAVAFPPAAAMLAAGLFPLALRPPQ
jgi:hypothetical protein